MENSFNGEQKINSGNEPPVFYGENGVNGREFSGNVSQNTAQYSTSAPLTPQNTVHTEFKNRKKYEMTKKDVAFLFVFAALAFFTMRLGIFNGYGAFGVMCMLFAGVFFAFVYNKNAENKGYYITLFVITELLSASFLFNNDGLFGFFNVVALLILASMCFPGISGNTVNRDGSYKELLEGLFYISVKSAKNLLLPFSSLKNERSLKKSKTVFQVLLGLAFAAPVVLVTTLLLSSYDGAFSELVNRLFESADISETFLALAVALFITPFIYSFSLVLRKKCTNGEKLKITKYTPKGSPIVFNTLLFTVSFVYVIYLFSQLAYITSAFAFLLPENYTSSEFAREGFFQMLLIAVINFLLTTVTTVAVKRTENGKIPLLTKIPNVFLCLFTLFFTASAFVGIVQYISKYGFTYLRTAVDVFIIMSAVIDIIMLLSLFVEKIPRVRLITVTVSVTLIALSFFNIDTIVSKANYRLFEKGVISLTSEDVYSFEAEELIKLFDSGLYEKITKYDGSENFTELSDFYSDDYFDWLSSLLRYYDIDKETGEFSPNSVDDVLSLNISDMLQIKTLEKNYDTLKRYEEARMKKYGEMLENSGYVCTDKEKGVYTLYGEEGEVEEITVVPKLYYIYEDYSEDSEYSYY